MSKNFKEYSLTIEKKEIISNFITEIVAGFVFYHFTRIQTKNFLKDIHFLYLKKKAQH